MKKSLVFMSTLYLALLVTAVVYYPQHVETAVIEDRAQLLPTQMKRITATTQTNELQDLLNEAAKEDRVITLAGTQHSQGGQTLYPGGWLIDMKEYDEILAFDPTAQTLTVQSGATWSKIQEYIQPHGLALQVTQSQSIFTVGGTMSVHAHGRDLRYNALSESIESFRLLTADGTILDVSKDQHADYFQNVLGGYGLFGIILDVTLRLTEDELYVQQTEELDYEDYPAYFKEQVLENPKAKMHLARLSTAPDTFLKDMYVTNYLVAPDQGLRDDCSKLSEERIIAIPKFMLGVARYSDTGKDWFWDVQQTYSERLDGDLITRNNAMRSDSTFMDYESSSRTEVLQEYFVPIDQYVSYVDALREVLERHDINLLNITVRYVERNEDTVLNYATSDMFSLVLLIHQPLDDESLAETDAAIEEMVAATLAHDGSYYLPYYQFPTQAQFQEAYPKWQSFQQFKEQADPKGRFQNLWYKEYFE